MEQKHHYTGLTDAQVLESRSKHGANILTPPRERTSMETIPKEVWRPSDYHFADSRSVVYRHFLL